MLRWFLLPFPFVAVAAVLGATVFIDDRALVDELFGHQPDPTTGEPPEFEVARALHKGAGPCLRYARRVTDRGTTIQAAEAALGAGLGNDEVETAGPTFDAWAKASEEKAHAKSLEAEILEVLALEKGRWVLERLNEDKLVRLVRAPEVHPVVPPASASGTLRTFWEKYGLVLARGGNRHVAFWMRSTPHTRRKVEAGRSDAAARAPGGSAETGAASAAFLSPPDAPPDGFPEVGQPTGLGNLSEALESVDILRKPEPNAEAGKQGPRPIPRDGQTGVDSTDGL